MKRALPIVVLGLMFAHSVRAEFDPLSGLGYDPAGEVADTSASQGVATLDDLTDGLGDDASTSESSTASSASFGDGEGMKIANQIKADCTEVQIAQYQPEVEACFGGKDACKEYSSAGCLAAEAPAEGDVLTIPLACLLECVAIRMEACKPVLQSVLDRCHGKASAGTPAPTPVTQTAAEPPPSSGCAGENKVRRGDYCVCAYGYQKGETTGACEFVTSGANLDPDGIDAVNDMVAAADADPNGAATATVKIDGKDVIVGVSADPNALGSYRYTVDGIHYAPTLAGATNPGFWSKVGNGLLDGTRRGLSMLSPFNWFGSGYGGEDKDTKDKIGREVIYDDLDAQRHGRVRDLKYMNDFLNGMALYIDLRNQGKTMRQIATGDQDIDAEINHATERMRTAANRTDKDLSDEDKARLQAAHDEQMYAAFEDGYRRYQLKAKMGK